MLKYVSYVIQLLYGGRLMLLIFRHFCFYTSWCTCKGIGIHSVDVDDKIENI